MLFIIFLGKTGWLTVAVNGTRQMPNRNFNEDALVSYPRLSYERHDQRQSNSKGLELLETSKWKAQFPLGNSIRKFWSTFQKIPFLSRKFPFGATKLIFPLTLHLNFPFFGD